MDYPQQHIKPYNEEGKKTEQVERMFDNIAHAYDKLNHTLSLGIDRSWRRKAIAWLRPFHPQRMMDGHGKYPRTTSFKENGEPCELSEIMPAKDTGLPVSNVNLRWFQGPCEWLISQYLSLPDFM